MLLKEIRDLIEDNIGFLNFIAQDQNYNNQTYKLISGLSQIKAAVNKFEKTGLFPELIKNIKQQDAFSFAGDQVRITTNEEKEFARSLQNLKLGLENFMEQLNQRIVATEENSILIKFPPFNDFQELGKAANAFHKLFTLTIYDNEINGHVKIYYVENGSAWWEVALGSVKAVSLIGLIASAAAYVMLARERARTEAENRRTRKISNDRLEMYQNAEAILLEDWIESRAHIIQTQNFKSESPEREEHFRQSIKLLAGEFERGARIFTTQKVPSNVSKLFPDFKNPLKIMDKFKKISDTSKDEIES